MDEAHLDPMRAGWLLEAPSKLSDAELARVRAIAADAGLVIEVRDQRSDLATISTTAAIAGALVALAILAMTIGLLRSDAEHQTRILAATGATSGTRRAITAFTTMTLAAVGAILGALTAYAALIAGYWPQTDQLGKIPIAQLSAIIVGLPLVATAVSWLASGREPVSLVRSRTE